MSRTPSKQSTQAGDRGEMNAPLYWVPHKDHGWLPATRTCDLPGNLVSFDSEGYRAITIPAKDAEALDAVEADQLLGVEDIAGLRFVNEAALLHTIRVRYLKNLVYTRVGKTVIATNPFTSLPIYDSHMVDRYAVTGDSAELPAHIFSIGKDALEGLRIHKRNQAILISGESGAGKTETAKLIMAFIADAVRCGDSDIDDAAEVPIEDKIVLTNPVLEAFGNAMTVRNHNSSRFGHWLDLSFSDDLALIGCSLMGYLLETMRVNSQAKSDRSFHIFYQLIQARAQLPDLHLLDAKQYNYLKGGQVKAPGIDDNMSFTQLCEALVVLGFSDAQQNEMFRIVASVLMLGNIDFEDCGDPSRSCRVKNDSTLEKVADMLGMDMESLRKCMLVKTIASQSESFDTPLTVDQACAARDTLSRLLYHRLFFYLISRMNTTLSSNVEDAQSSNAGFYEDDGRLLGILDIPGFENLEQNSLEQLLINLSNELLHQHFNEVIFSNEAAEAEKEGVPALEAVQFTDNAEILAFIDSRNGALDILDDTMTLPGGSDAAFVNKVIRRHEKDKCLLTEKFDALTFGISHFAGEVFYSCDGWLEKNAESPPTGAIELLTSSKLDLLQCLGEKMAIEASAEDSMASKGARKKVKSVSSGFRTSLKELMTKIRQTDPHYVLCMKPNMEKVAKKFHGKNVLQQLLTTGVLGAVKMRQKGYAHRILHDDFAFDYQCIVDAAPTSRSKAKQSPEDVARLLDALPKVLNELGCTSVNRADFALGSTKVFFKESAYESLQEGRRYRLSSSAAKIQRRFKIFQTRQLITEWKRIRDDIRNCLEPLNINDVDISGKDGWPIGESILARLPPDVQGVEILECLEEILLNAEFAGFQGRGVVQAECAFNRLQLELDVSEEIDDASKSVDPVEIEKVLTRATKMKLPFKEKLQNLETRLNQLRTQMPLKKAMERAFHAVRIVDKMKPEESEEVDQVRKTLKAVEEAGLSDEQGTWVPELDASKLIRSLRGIAAPIRERIRTEHLGKLLDDVDDDGDDAEARGRAHTATAGYPSLRKDKAELRIGMSIEEEKDLRKQLKKAVDECNLEMLEKLIAEAVENGMDQDSDSEASDSDGASSFGSSSDSEEENKPEDEFTLKLARKALRRMHDTQFLRRQLQRVKHEVNEFDTVSVSSLKKLEQLARQLGQIPGCEDDARAARDFVQKTLLKSNRKCNRQTIFDTQDHEELDLASKIFGNLSAFARLKDSRPWVNRLRHGRSPHAFGLHRQTILRNSNRQSQLGGGAYRQSILRQSTFGARQSIMQNATSIPGAYRQSILRNSGQIGGIRQSQLQHSSPASRRQSWRTCETSPTSPTSRRQSWRTCGTNESEEHGSDAMMSHGKVIIESLTWHPDGFDKIEYEATATQNFRNILYAMGDRPAQDCQRVGSRLAIVALAQSDARMHDEIYMQILKQLINNDIPRSMGLGWELLYNLVKEVRPSDQLIEFVRVFITQGLNQMEFSGVSYFYALRIARLLGCRGEFREGAMRKDTST